MYSRSSFNISDQMLSFIAVVKKQKTELTNETENITKGYEHKNTNGQRYLESLVHQTQTQSALCISSRYKNVAIVLRTRAVFKTKGLERV